MTPDLFSPVDETSGSGQQVQLCSMMSGLPTVAEPSPTRRPPEAREFAEISFTNYSIAINPIKYIRIPFSLYYFKPDSNIINNDRMPGKPFLPCGSIFGFHSHFVILFRLALRDPQRSLWRMIRLCWSKRHGRSRRRPARWTARSTRDEELLAERSSRWSCAHRAGERRCRAHRRIAMQPKALICSVEASSPSRSAGHAGTAGLNVDIIENYESSTP